MSGNLGLLLLAAEEHHDTFHHVKDSRWIDLPFIPGDKDILLDFVNGEHFQFTKFMFIQIIAVLLVMWIFRGLAKRASSGEPVRGRWWNFWDMLALFIRDDMVRPIIGEAHHHGDHGHGDAHGGGDGHSGETRYGHRADRYLPFIWTCFFYVLICNLLGALPSLGSVTSDLNVTGVLALVVLVTVIYYGTKEAGFVGFWKNQCPPMDLPGAMGVVMKPLIWAIEVVGLFIKHSVLAVRLFANILGGHTVMAVILGFIAQTAATGLWYVVTPASLFGLLAIGMLELFVAFVQAYVFSILATLFISAAVNPH